MTVAGGQWPMLVYASIEYHTYDHGAGFFRSPLLVYVSVISAIVGLQF
jgi:hypothetical protein